MTTSMIWFLAVALTMPTVMTYGRETAGKERLFNPKIGVVATALNEETQIAVSKAISMKVTSCIPSHVVNILHLFGAEVFPIFDGKTEDQYRNYVKSTNGMVMSSDRKNFDTSSKHTLWTVRKVFKIMKEEDKIPFFAISPNADILKTIIEDEDSNSPIRDVQEMKGNRPGAYSKENEDDRPEASRFVDLQVPIETFMEHGLDEFFEVTATGFDLIGKEYLLAAKHKSNPYYFVQISPNQVVSELVSPTHRSSPSWYSVEDLRRSKKVVNFFTEFVERACKVKSSLVEEESIPEIRKYKTFDLRKILKDDSLGLCYFDMLLE